MNFALVGLLVITSYGISGCIISGVSHGLISSALFSASGMLYDRYHTRNLAYYGGLSKTLPILSTLFFIAILGNYGFPGFIAYIGEIFTLIGIIEKSTIVTSFPAAGLILSTIYSVWLFDHIFNGPSLKSNRYYDLTRIEVFVLMPLVGLAIILGIAPNILLTKINFISILLSVV